MACFFFFQPPSTLWLVGWSSRGLPGLRDHSARDTREQEARGRFYSQDSCTKPSEGLKEMRLRGAQTRTFRPKQKRPHPAFPSFCPNPPTLLNLFSPIWLEFMILPPLPFFQPLRKVNCYPQGIK